MKNTWPPDGGYGWVIVFATVFLQMLGALPFTSYGVFLVELLDNFDTDLKTLSWLGAVVVSANAFSNIITGTLIKTYGCRPVGLFFTLVLVCSFIASAFVTDITLLYLTFGILPSTGLSCFFLCSAVTTQKYFEKRRSLAIGIGVTGLSLGAFVWPSFISWLLRENGLKNSLLIIAGIYLHGFVLISLLIQPEDRYPKLYILTHPQESITKEKNTTSTSSFKLCFRNISEVLSGIFNRKLFGNVRFMLVCFATFAWHLGHMVPYGYLPTKAIHLGADKTQAALLVSIIGACSGTMRILFGWLGDKPYMNRTILYGVSASFSGLLTSVSYFILSYIPLVVYAACFGVISACYVSMLYTVPVDVLGKEHMATGLGALGLASGTGILSTYILSGWILDMTEDPGKPFLYLGFIQMLLCLSVLMVPCMDKRESNTKKQNTRDDEELCTIVPLTNHPHPDT